MKNLFGILIIISLLAFGCIRDDPGQQDRNDSGWEIGTNLTNDSGTNPFDSDDKKLPVLGENESASPDAQKKGCDYRNPKCADDHECINNKCILRKGCDYDNPRCGDDYLCKKNECVLNSGCDYDNPSCKAGYDCVENKCKLKSGCSYDNPSCGADYSCIENECVLKSGCNYDNPSCDAGYECIMNECIETDEDLCPYDYYGSICIQMLLHYALPSCEEGQIPVDGICLEYENIIGAGEEVAKVMVGEDGSIFAKSYERESSEWVLYRSSDSGESWLESFRGNALYFDIDKVRGEKVYVVDYDSIFYSNDFGSDFSKVSDLPEGVHPASVFTDRFESGTLYIGHHNNPGFWGLLKSDDHGESLDYISFGDSIDVPREDREIVNNRIIWGINQDPQNPSIIYATGEDGTHARYEGSPHYDQYYTVRTFDGGKNWETISENASWHSLDIIPYVDQDGDTVWILEQETSGLRRLDPGSDEWSGRISLHFRTFDYHAHDSELHLMLSSSSIFVSEDGGNSWREIYKDPEADFHSFGFDADGNIYIADFNSGILKIYGFMGLFGS